MRYLWTLPPNFALVFLLDSLIPLWLLVVVIFLTGYGLASLYEDLTEIADLRRKSRQARR